MRMRRHKSKPEQLLKFIDSLEPEVAPKIRAVIDTLEPEVANKLSHKGIRRGSDAAGGLALVTAASAGISALRGRL